MIRAGWEKIRNFILNPIGFGSIVLFMIMLLGAGFLWTQGISYEYPGPAVAIAMLAAAIFLVGVGINDLQLKSSRLRSNKESKTAGLLPLVSGLELLVERWQGFKPNKDDRQILNVQIQIALSIMQLHYSGSSQIRFIKYFPGAKIKSGAFLLTASPNITPLVLKFERLSNIVKEKKSYEHCVQEFLRDTAGKPWEPSQRYGRIENEDWGAIAYNFVGEGVDPNTLARLQTLGEYYLNNGERQIVDVLHRTFKAIEPWWLMRRGWPGDCLRGGIQSVYDEYSRLTRKDKAMLEGIRQVGKTLDFMALERLEADLRYLDLDMAKFRNPFNWLNEVFKGRQLAAWSDYQRQDSIVHGDFHTGNILIATGKPPKVWLIDFPHAHIGPTIQDLARLEADIRFGLTSDETLQTLGINGLCDFEMVLLPDFDPDAHSLAALVPTDLAPHQQAVSQLPKVRRTVHLLREEARKYMSGYDARPYYLALLHATLPMLDYRDRSPWQKLSAFISAARLCEHLGN